MMCCECNNGFTKKKKRRTNRTRTLKRYSKWMTEGTTRIFHESIPSFRSFVKNRSEMTYYAPRE